MNIAEKLRDEAGGIRMCIKHLEEQMHSLALRARRLEDIAEGIENAFGLSTSPPREQQEFEALKDLTYVRAAFMVLNKAQKPLHRDEIYRQMKLSGHKVPSADKLTSPLSRSSEIHHIGNGVWATSRQVNDVNAHPIFKALAEET